MSHRGPQAPLASAGSRWPNPGTVHPVRLAQREARSATTGVQVHWPRTWAAKGALPLQAGHLRYREDVARTPDLHLIALDTSGSMRQGGRLGRAKGYAARLIEEAARAGERVALLHFGGQGVHWPLPPGPARRAGAVRVQPLGGGGGTPLRAGLAEAERVLRQDRRRHAGGARWLWLITDGRTLERVAAPSAPDHTVIVDLDDPLRPIGRCAAWAASWGAEHRRPPTH